MTKDNYQLVANQQTILNRISPAHMHKASEKVFVFEVLLEKSSEYIDMDSPTSADELKEDDAPELRSDKKTDEIIEPQKPVSLMWRVSSGLYNTTTGAITGAVGLGVGSVKWVAGKSYDAGSAVVGTTKMVVSKVPVPVPKWRTKPKSE